MDLKPKVVEVTEANFEEVVLKGSQERVIVVDFWAPWCAPCRTLGPVLEEVVDSLGPEIALVKVNVDENQGLAMAFRVQGIPAVKVVKDGRLVQEFTGALPKDQIEAILQPLVPTVTTAEDQLLEQAEAKAEAGDLRGAAKLFERLLAEQPAEPKALLGLARVRLEQGQLEAVQELVNLIEEGTPEYAPARALLAQIGFGQVCKESGGRARCAQRLLADPHDLEARYSLGCCAAVEGEYETALAEWLRLVEQRRDFRNGAAREAMVAVFHLLGRQHELVTQYQRRLYQALH